MGAARAFQRSSLSDLMSELNADFLLFRFTSADDVAISRIAKRHNNTNRTRI
jgi:hypothetical protein